jgi:hypothetical protein
MASDYMPSTSEIREGYAEFWPADDPAREVARKWFDRWLAKHDRDVAAWAVLDYERGEA